MKKLLTLLASLIMASSVSAMEFSGGTIGDYPDGSVAPNPMAVELVELLTSVTPNADNMEAMKELILSLSVQPITYSDNARVAAPSTKPSKGMKCLPVYYNADNGRLLIQSTYIMEEVGVGEYLYTPYTEPLLFQYHENTKFLEYIGQ